jgi:hypothetical protein
MVPPILSKESVARGATWVARDAADGESDANARTRVRFLVKDVTDVPREAVK